MELISLDTQNDIEYLMKRIQYFHDATTGGFSWKMGDPCDYGYNIILNVIFNIIWGDGNGEIQNKTIELEFSGLQEFHYFPPEVYESCPLFPGASFLQKDGEIIWEASWISSPNEHTTIRSITARWRITDYQGGLLL